MRKYQDILSAIGGYEKSRIILTASELGLFNQIHRNMASANEIAIKNDLKVKATKRILDCLVAFHLL